MINKLKAFMMMLFIPVVVLTSCSKTEQGYTTEGVAPGKTINIAKDNFQNYFIITGHVGDYYVRTDSTLKRITAVYASITPDLDRSTSLVTPNIDLEAKVTVYYREAHIDNNGASITEYKTHDLIIKSTKISEGNPRVPAVSSFENNDYLQLPDGNSPSYYSYSLYNYKVEIIKASGTLKISNDIRCYESDIKMENAYDLFDINPLKEIGREQKDNKVKIYYSIGASRNNSSYHGFSVLFFDKASIKIAYEIGFQNYRPDLIFKGDIDLKFTAFGYALKIVEITIDNVDSRAVLEYSIRTSLKDANGVMYLDTTLQNN